MFRWARARAAFGLCLGLLWRHPCSAASVARGSRNGVEIGEKREALFWGETELLVLFRGKAELLDVYQLLGFFGSKGFPRSRGFPGFREENPGAGLGSVRKI